MELLWSFYTVLFAALVILVISIELGSTGGDSLTDALLKQPPPQFRAFRNNYLLVYSLAMAGDWLQGPYIYALYEHYGYKVGDIGRLFIAGFGSSMVFGTVVGAMADKCGRRLACVTYMVTYSLSCLTKHSGDFWVLLFGRLLGGVSTSLLFSAFESWLVAEHFSRGYSESLLNETFSKAVFLGAGLMAIISGLAGNVLVESLKLGPVAPFDAAIVVMTVGGLIIMATWPENYGDNSEHSLLSQFQAAASAITRDEKVALLGAMQSMFEAAMFTFVFLWTPALSPKGEKVPHGIVFSCFMTACMLGSALTGQLMKRYRPQSFMILMYLTAACSLLVPFVFHLEHRPEDAGSSLGSDKSQGGISTHGKVQLIAFCVFEACVGIFWPSMMALRAHYVPEEMRSTIINIFRIPLNLFVCLVLFKVSSFPLSVMFGLCVLLMLLCVGCQWRLNYLTQNEEARWGQSPLSSKPHADSSPKVSHSSTPLLPRSSVGGIAINGSTAASTSEHGRTRPGRMHLGGIGH